MKQCNQITISGMVVTVLLLSLVILGYLLILNTNDMIKGWDNVRTLRRAIMPFAAYNPVNPNEHLISGIEVMSWPIDATRTGSIYTDDFIRAKDALEESK